MFSCPCTAEAEPSLSWVTATLKWATEYQLRPWWFEEDAPTALFLSTEGSPVHDFGHNHLYSDWAPFRDDQERCWITICCPQSAELKSNSTIPVLALVSQTPSSSAPRRIPQQSGHSSAAPVKGPCSSRCRHKCLFTDKSLPSSAETLQ